MNIRYICILLFEIVNVSCIMWNLKPNSKKCLKEELEQNVLVSGEFEVSPVFNQKVNYVIRDSQDHILAQQEDISKGKFSFITENDNVYELCFNSRVPYNAEVKGVSQDVYLVIKHDIEVKDYEIIGEVMKLKPVEVELNRLVHISDSILKEFSRMLKREQKMRNTNESTNKRVLYLNIVSKFVIFGSAMWQILYLRRYFKVKKLID